ncbi:hypothetical protein [Rhizobium sp.]|uniref:hypothetical protein n=1 Tax=Rhizobium sp. TaxID=391 RepID=UPI0028AC9B8C
MNCHSNFFQMRLDHRNVMQIFKVFVTNLDSLGVRIEAVKIGISTKKTMHGFRDFNGNALVHGDDPFEDRIYTIRLDTSPAAALAAQGMIL